MALSDKLAQELQQIIKNKTGKELTIEEARTHGDAWVRYIELLWEIDQENKKRDKNRKKSKKSGLTK